MHTVTRTAAARAAARAQATKELRREGRERSRHGGSKLFACLLYKKLETSTAPRKTSLWVCVLPRGQLNVNVNLEKLLKVEFRQLLGFRFQSEGPTKSGGRM